MADRRLDRRTFLELAGSAGAAVALAGCPLGSSDGDGPSTDDGTDTDDEPDDPSGDSPDNSGEEAADSLGEESWPQYRFDRGNTGHAPDNAGPAADPARRWSATAGATGGTAPVRANGTVYVDGEDGVLYALDEVDGSELWTFDAGSSLRTPAVIEGTVYATTADGYAYAVDADGGSKRWEYRVGVPLQPPTVAHGTVYTGGERGTVHALSAADGSEQWLYRIGEPITAPLAATTDRLVAGTESGTGPVEPHGTLWTLTTGGDLAWYDTGLEAAVVGVAATDGPGVASDEDGNLYGFRSKYKSGAELLWSEQLAGSGDPMPAMADGTAYVARGQYVTAVDVSDGTEQWAEAPGAVFTSAPAVVGGTAYVGHESGLYALDVSSGSLEWELDHGAAMGPPAVANGTVAVGSSDSGVYVFGAE